MDRRDLLKASILAAITTSFPQLDWASAEKRPNVLLLMSDQHKRSCMGAYGDNVAKTPHLDALAERSVRFTDVYCTNPVCTPSRASILTGLYSHHHEAQDNAHGFSSNHKTMAHHFGAAGYTTALIGKMHWVDAQTHGFDYRLEFNDWLQYLGPKVKLYADELAIPNSGSGLPEIDSLWKDEGDPWKGVREKDDREGFVHNGRVSKIPEQDQFDSFVARESVRFLHQHREEGGPFFLITSFLKPHDPFMPAQRFADMFRPEDMHLPASWGKADLSTLPREVVKGIQYNNPTPEVRDPEQAKRHIAFYYANLAQMDDALGQVMQALKDTGHDRDTIICYTSDHGEMLGDLGLWQKFEFYEGSCGVPLLIHVPGGDAGVAHVPLSQVSLSATLTSLAGVKLVQPNDGVSFATLVKKPESTFEAGPVFAEYELGKPRAKYMVREGYMKYIYRLNDRDELYDLKADPMELRNLAVDPRCRPAADRLKAVLFAWHNPSL
ncbi:MAG: sulfatase-like hydrolase/transferase [Acidobacteriaceae bacterium]|nr:sulfatase-like hydrolase/transferase [Acidobacteriaceae bacterium]